MPVVLLSSVSGLIKQFEILSVGQISSTELWACYPQRGHPEGPWAVDQPPAWGCPLPLHDVALCQPSSWSCRSAVGKSWMSCGPTCSSRLDGRAGQGRVFGGESGLPPRAVSLPLIPLPPVALTFAFCPTLVHKVWSTWQSSPTDYKGVFWGDVFFPKHQFFIYHQPGTERRDLWYHSVKLILWLNTAFWVNPWCISASNTTEAGIQGRFTTSFLDAAYESLAYFMSFFPSSLLSNLQEHPPMAGMLCYLALDRVFSYFI